ncbi:MAG: NAD-dependent DNA ligase LigA [Kiritimatiellae bacterium]|nr:NAD-dependent DNA ligase LigA [Kiritimatiellia bacterium]
MTLNEEQKRLEFLRSEINRHDRLYYVEARPEIGDADYDLLYREMLAIEQAHPEWVTPDSPSQRVSGAPVSGFKQVRHDPPMRSLDKTHSKAELGEFDAFLRKQLPGEVWDYVVEPKVDGVSLSLLYLDGVLTRAATRGNGEIGDDITQNMKTIKSIPLRVPDAPSVLEVRGECYMTRNGFAELNRREEEAGREPFANPRNAAAGSMKQLDPAEVARRPLDIVIYASGAISGMTFGTHTEMIRQFAKWGFKTPPWQRLCVDIGAVYAAIDELERMRHDFPFEIDGAVVKLNRRDLYGALGMTAHAPRWARAYKYAPERAETRIRAVTVQVGRSGVLTPVAELDPVPLAGSVISRATLHNAEDVARRDIRIGDHVWLVKAGDVIPAIDSVITEKRDGSEQVFVMPDACPECGAPAVKLEGEVATRCTNPACPAQRIGRLIHFCSRNALDIRAIGDKVAVALVTQGFVEDPLDLFSLTKAQLEDLNIGDEKNGVRRFGKNASSTLETLETARGRTLERWLFAIGIPNIGVTASEQVAGVHRDLAHLASLEVVDAVLRLYELGEIAASAKREKRTEDFNRACGEIGVIGASLVELGVASVVPETVLPPEYVCVIKPEMAKSLHAFFTSPYGKQFVERLDALGIHPKAKEKPKAAAGVLAGKTFVLTGSLSRPRPEIAEMIKNAGGIVQGSVSGKTNFLVAGENVGAAKTQKAAALGTKVIHEDELMAMLQGGTAPAASAPAETPSPAAKPSRKKQKEESIYTQEFLF